MQRLYSLEDIKEKFAYTPNSIKFVNGYMESLDILIGNDIIIHLKSNVPAYEKTFTIKEENFVSFLKDIKNICYYDLYSRDLLFPVEKDEYGNEINSFVNLKNIVNIPLRFVLKENKGLFHTIGIGSFTNDGLFMLFSDYCHGK